MSEFMNETIQTILTRRSNRSYLDKPVEKEKIDLILQCGVYSPTARGVQPWHFTVVENRRLLDKISEINKREYFANNNQNAKMSGLTEDYDNFRGAPMAIIISGMNGEKYAEVDCANAFDISEREREVGGVPIGNAKLFYQALSFGGRECRAERGDIPPQERAARREGIINYVK